MTSRSQSQSLALLEGEKHEGFFVPGFLPAVVRGLETPRVTEAMLRGEPLSASEAEAELVRRAHAAQAFALAQGQGMQLMQTGLMMYFMIGNRLNLWSIFFLVQMGTPTFGRLLGVNAAFAPHAQPGVDLTAAKAIYVLINFVGVALFFWKLRAMGLLPITSSDWISLLPIRVQTEYSVA